MNKGTSWLANQRPFRRLRSSFYEKIVRKIMIKVLIANELKYQYRRQNDEASSGR